MSKSKETGDKDILGKALKMRLEGKGDPRKPLRYPNNRCPDVELPKKGNPFAETILDDYFDK